jgi:peptidoglycan hydrolase CwlO-like protein
MHDGAFFVSQYTRTHRDSVSMPAPALTTMMKETTMTEKELYLQKANARLKELQAEVDKLKAKASVASGEIQRELTVKMESLDNRIEQGKGKLNELETASDEAWESLKSGLESAWDSVNNAFNDAAGKLG